MLLDGRIEAGVQEIWDLVSVGEIRDVRVMARFVEPFVRWQDQYIGQQEQEKSQKAPNSDRPLASRQPPKIVACYVFYAWQGAGGWEESLRIQVGS